MTVAITNDPRSRRSQRRRSSCCRCSRARAERARVEDVPREPCSRWPSVAGDRRRSRFDAGPSAGLPEALRDAMRAEPDVTRIAQAISTGRARSCSRVASTCAPPRRSRSSSPRPATCSRARGRSPISCTAPSRSSSRSSRCCWSAPADRWPADVDAIAARLSDYGCRVIGLFDAERTAGRRRCREDRLGAARGADPADARRPRAAARQPGGASRAGSTPTRRARCTRSPEPGEQAPSAARPRSRHRRQLEPGAAVSQGGRIVAEASAPGANVALIDPTVVEERLTSLIDQLGSPQPAACCAGAAGAEVPAGKRRLEELLARLLPGCRVLVVHDTRLVLAAAGLDVRDRADRGHRVGRLRARATEVARLGSADGGGSSATRAAVPGSCARRCAS